MESSPFSEITDLAAHRGRFRNITERSLVGVYLKHWWALKSILPGGSRARLPPKLFWEVEPEELQSMRSVTTARFTEPLKPNRNVPEN